MEAESQLAQAEGYNLTDFKSRILKDHNSFVQAYDAQAAVEDKASTVMTYYWSNNAADHDAVALLLDAVTANIGTTPAGLSADSGYCSKVD